MKVMITGADGMLGLSLVNALKGIGSCPIALTINDLDITDSTNARKAFEKYEPDIVLNAAAYTDVDGSEDNVEEARRVNVLGAEVLGKLCCEKHIKVVHYSSDYVFKGCGDVPLSENDQPSPQGEYAKSKFDGEKELRRSGASHLIIRTAWLFAPWGNNFVKKILARAQANEPLSVVTDQIGSPTYTPDLAMATLELLVRRSEGTVNVVNSGEASWHELAMMTLQEAGLEREIAEITTDTLNLKAPRPRYSVLASHKLERLLGRPMRHWREALSDCVALIKEKSE